MAILKFSAAVDDAVCTEWALKTEVSTPTDSSRDFKHLAIVLDVTVLNGLIRARNSFDSVPLTGAVHTAQALRVAIGHSPRSCGNDGKKNSFPCLDYLARLVEVKTTPAGL